MKNLKFLIGCSTLFFFLGLALRFLYPSVFEFKEDERLMFEYSQMPFFSFVQYGMPSGVYFPNPPASVWPFQVLAKLFRLQTPFVLNLAVICINSLALLGLFFSKKSILLRFALAMASVNPLLILYHRKIWAQSILTPFLAVFTLCIFKRNRHPFYFGMIGFLSLFIAQIHMSGFFLFFAATYVFIFFEPSFFKKIQNAFFYSLGTCIALIPMLPWLFDRIENATQTLPVLGVFEDFFQFRAFIFFLTTPFGLHLGNFLGVHVSNSAFYQLMHFSKFPNDTFVAGACIAFSALFFLYNLLKLRIKLVFNHLGFFTAFMHTFLLNVSTLLVKRYYLLAIFPFDHLLWILSGMRLRKRRKQYARLFVFFLFTQFLLSTLLIFYLKENNGAPNGDFGQILQPSLK